MDTKHIEWLESEIDRYRKTIASSQVALDAMLRALANAKGEDQIDDSPASPVRRERLARGMVKDVVIRLVTENAERGLVAGELVDLAKGQGVTLEKSSVSSLLSKLKLDGILDYDGNTYRPRKPNGIPLSGVAPPSPGGLGIFGDDPRAKLN